MVQIELMDSVSTYDGGPNEPLFDEPGKTPADTDFGSSSGLGCDVADGEGTSSSSENRKDGSVERRGDRLRRVL
jgi:hypothetical protein